MRLIWLKRARARHVIWLMAFAKFLLPIHVVVPSGAGNGGESSVACANGDDGWADAEVLLLIAEPVPQETQSDAGAGHNEIYCIFTALWLFCNRALFARWAWRRRQFAAIALAGEKVETGREAAMLEDLKIRLNVSRRVG